MSEYDTILEEARKAGYESGVNAGSWVIDSNTSPERAAYILRGVEDVDPEVMDQLPSSPLSGEWAGDPTVWSSLDLTGDEDYANEVLDYYEEGFYEGVEAEVIRACHALLD